MLIEPLNVSSYSTFTGDNPVVLVHFWAAWNAYDCQMRERLVQLAESYKGRVSFGSVDVDLPEMAETCSGLKILNVTGLAYYLNGKHVETTLGLLSKKQIEEKLDHLLGSRVT